MSEAHPLVRVVGDVDLSDVHLLQVDLAFDGDGSCAINCTGKGFALAFADWSEVRCDLQDVRPDGLVLGVQAGDLVGACFGFVKSGRRSVPVAFMTDLEVCVHPGDVCVKKIRGQRCPERGGMLGRCVQGGGGSRPFSGCRDCCACGKR